MIYQFVKANCDSQESTSYYDCTTNIIYGAFAFSILAQGSDLLRHFAAHYCLDLCILTFTLIVLYYNTFKYSSYFTKSFKALLFIGIFFMCNFPGARLALGVVLLLSYSTFKDQEHNQKVLQENTLTIMKLEKERSRLEKEYFTTLKLAGFFAPIPSTTNTADKGVQTDSDNNFSTTGQQVINDSTTTTPEDCHFFVDCSSLGCISARLGLVDGDEYNNTISSSGNNSPLPMVVGQNTGDELSSFSAVNATADDALLLSATCQDGVDDYEELVSSFGNFSLGGDTPSTTSTAIVVDPSEFDNGVNVEDTSTSGYNSPVKSSFVVVHNDNYDSKDSSVSVMDSVRQFDDDIAINSADAMVSSGATTSDTTTPTSTIMMTTKATLNTTSIAAGEEQIVHDHHYDDEKNIPAEIVPPAATITDMVDNSSTTGQMMVDDIPVVVDNSCTLTTTTTNMIATATANMMNEPRVDVLDSHDHLVYLPTTTSNGCMDDDNINLGQQSAQPATTDDDNMEISDVDDNDSVMVDDAILFDEEDSVSMSSLTIDKEITTDEMDTAFGGTDDCTTCLEEEMGTDSVVDKDHDMNCCTTDFNMDLYTTPATTSCPNNDIVMNADDDQPGVLGINTLQQQQQMNTAADNSLGANQLQMMATTDNNNNNVNDYNNTTEQPTTTSLITTINDTTIINPEIIQAALNNPASIDPNLLAHALATVDKLIKEATATTTIADGIINYGNDDGEDNIQLLPTPATNAGEHLVEQTLPFSVVNLDAATSSTDQQQQPLFVLDDFDTDIPLNFNVGVEGFTVPVGNVDEYLVEQNNNQEQQLPTSILDMDDDPAGQSLLYDIGGDINIMDNFADNNDGNDGNNDGSNIEEEQPQKPPFATSVANDTVQQQPQQQSTTTTMFVFGSSNNNNNSNSDEQQTKFDFSGGSGFNYYYNTAGHSGGGKGKRPAYYNTMYSPDSPIAALPPPTPTPTSSFNFAVSSSSSPPQQQTSRSTGKIGHQPLRPQASPPPPPQYVDSFFDSDYEEDEQEAELEAQASYRDNRRYYS